MDMLLHAYIKAITSSLRHQRQNQCFLWKDPGVLRFHYAAHNMFLTISLISETTCDAKHACCVNILVSDLDFLNFSFMEEGKM